MLETRGYRVASYSRGEEALERFKQGGVDLVVTDMAMPGLDGPQLIAAIKNLSPHTPAILISSKVRVYDHESQADVFLARGMYAPADLLERIRLLLVRKRGPKRMQERPPQFSPTAGSGLEPQFHRRVRQERQEISGSVLFRSLVFLGVLRALGG